MNATVAISAVLLFAGVAVALFAAAGVLAIALFYDRLHYLAPSTLAALRAVPNVYRTDRDGTVVVRAAGGRMTVETGA